MIIFVSAMVLSNETQKAKQTKDPTKHTNAMVVALWGKLPRVDCLTGFKYSLNRSTIQDLF